MTRDTESGVLSHPYVFILFDYTGRIGDFVP